MVKNTAKKEQTLESTANTLTPASKLFLSQHRTMTTNLSTAQSAMSLVATGVSIHLSQQKKETS